jgi:hypothetical protein
MGAPTVTRATVLILRALWPIRRMTPDVIHITRLLMRLLYTCAAGFALEIYLNLGTSHKLPAEQAGEGVAVRYPGRLRRRLCRLFLCLGRASVRPAPGRAAGHYPVQQRRLGRDLLPRSQSAGHPRGRAVVRARRWPRTGDWLPGPATTGSTGISVSGDGATGPVLCLAGGLQHRRGLPRCEREPGGSARHGPAHERHRAAERRSPVCVRVAATETVAKLMRTTR